MLSPVSLSVRPSVTRVDHTTRKLCYRKDDSAMRAIQVHRELLRRYGHSKLSKMAAAAIGNLFESKIAPLDPPSLKTREPHHITRSDDRLRRYGHLKFVQDGDGRHLGFVLTGNSAIRSAVPENPTLEQNMTWIGSPVAEISPLEIFPTWRWPPSWICSNRKYM